MYFIKVFDGRLINGRYIVEFYQRDVSVFAVVERQQEYETVTVSVSKSRKEAEEQYDSLHQMLVMRGFALK